MHINRQEEKSIVIKHGNAAVYKFVIYVPEKQSKLPTIYWLPKLHKRPYKARFIANSSSCTTTELLTVDFMPNYYKTTSN